MVNSLYIIYIHGDNGALPMDSTITTGKKISDYYITLRTKNKESEILLLSYLSHIK